MRCVSHSPLLDSTPFFVAVSTADRRSEFRDGDSSSPFRITIRSATARPAIGLSVLVSPAQLRLAAALLILSPYVPLLFMGEEYGETNPFQYFIDHGDDRLVAAVRDGRRREFESFGWGSDVPDAQDDATFRRSKLDWSKADA